MANQKKHQNGGFSSSIGFVIACVGSAGILCHNCSFILIFIISYNTFWGVECVVVFVLDFVRHVLACYALPLSS